MSDASAVLEALPARLRHAIDAGWRGMTLIEVALSDADSTQPVLLVSSPNAEALIAARAPLGVRVVHEEDAARMLVLAILDEERGPLELGIDLGFVDARALARRLANAGEVPLIVVGPDVESARIGRVPLGRSARAVMLEAVAEAGEWRVEQPDGICEIPDEGDALPRLVPVGSDSIALQVPLEQLASMSDRNGRADIDLDVDPDAPALRIRPAGQLRLDADELVLSLDDPGQLALAEQLADLPSLMVLGVLPGDDRFVAQALARLGAESRDAFRRMRRE